MRKNGAMQDGDKMKTYVDFPLDKDDKTIKWEDAFGEK